MIWLDVFRWLLIAAGGLIIGVSAVLIVSARFYRWVQLLILSLVIASVAFVRIELQLLGKDPTFWFPVILVYMLAAGTGLTLLTAQVFQGNMIIVRPLSKEE